MNTNRMLPFILLTPILASAGCLESCPNPEPATLSLFNGTNSTILVQFEVHNASQTIQSGQVPLEPNEDHRLTLNTTPNQRYHMTLTVAGHEEAQQTFTPTCGGGGVSAAVRADGINVAELVVD